jgi:hypothetical protein
LEKSKQDNKKLKKTKDENGDKAEGNEQELQRAIRQINSIKQASEDRSKDYESKVIFI